MVISKLVTFYYSLRTKFDNAIMHIYLTKFHLYKYFTQYIA